MKRFLETSDWNKPWFQDLSAIEKCLWRYINDNCDCAGIWDPNWKQASFQIGSKVTEETAQVFAGRLQKLSDGSLRIIGFITLQYGKLSRECKPHTPVFAALEARGLTFEGLSERVAIPIECPSEGKNYLQEKEKDKDKVQEKEEWDCKGGDKGKPESREACVDYAVQIGLPGSDGEWFYDKGLASGWKNSGKPIADWKATMRCWKPGTIFPSRKLGLPSESIPPPRLVHRVERDNREYPQTFQPKML